jgi:hypothetical protein
MQEQVYKHVCNHVARSNWNHEKDLSPSPYLDAHMTILQKQLLNPTHKQLVTGYVLFDCKGQGAMQMVAKRRLDMIEGNISSYSRILNDPQRMVSLRDLNKLTAAVALVSADKQSQLEKTKVKNKEMTNEKN